MSELRPKAELLTHTPDPLRLLYAQTRGTTTSKGFAAVYNDPVGFFPKALRQDPTYDPVIHHEITTGEMIRLVDDALAAGHWSVARGVSFTFAFSVSRSEGRQMLRHVVGVAWEEMSQRYVKLLNRDYQNELEQLGTDLDYAVRKDRAQTRVRAAALVEHLNKVFVVPEHIERGDPQALLDWTEVRNWEVRQYLTELQNGALPEDARENLPNCTRTEMIATISLEALHNLLGKRLCTRAQAPVRATARAMRKAVTAKFPYLAKHLTVQCMPERICPESRPDGCPLLAENGGNVLRKSQAQDAITAHLKTLRAL